MNRWIMLLDFFPRMTFESSINILLGGPTLECTIWFLLESVSVGWNSCLTQCQAMNKGYISTYDHLNYIGYIFLNDPLKATNHQVRKSWCNSFFIAFSRYDRFDLFDFDVGVKFYKSQKIITEYISTDK